ncbi:DUF2339 domain-containing protein [Aequorivita antarctica]|uniref:DUF2339 domain-containing protein n=1 Tax=Aequorivita antarctica TaxID=153266 RepID=A0A5C6YX13_9FLAO|nr:DUF2339 domain-containing protein [Aequorivita antarctica]TXD72150.1 DUF2339 domain-containing protein [Aequorivita antarctica]SRX75164.1 hypothetical protein AEQU3_02158 [Aequorivita antarctica]
MQNNSESLKALNEKLEMLLKKQELFSREIWEIKGQIQAFNIEANKDIPKEIEQITEPENHPISPEPVFPRKQTEEPLIALKQQTIPPTSTPRYSAKQKSDLEKFIGENLINKIGILITIIGVAIGAKYSIENDLISPLTRIILGYVMGLGLLGFGIKLKEKYKNFSAVLVSGAMVIMYFITFAAYSFYEIIPQTLTFLLMVIFTVFTVVAALNYNLSIIAHLGLVGAYAVPFLLSNDSGRLEILFSYVAIINIGILFISFKKYWKSIYYSSFLLTWIIYLSWYFFSYISENFTLAFVFLTVFFVIFYCTFLAYKLIKKEKYDIGDILLLLANSFIFYCVGYSLLSDYETGEELLGLFTLANAIVHFSVSAFIYKRNLADKNLFYLIAGLVLVFITVAVPVQLDGNWVTLVWAGEAALLFWIGRTKNVPVYEKLSYILMVLAFISLAQDWMFYSSYNSLGEESTFTPIFNLRFLTGVLFLAAFGFINYLLQNEKFPSPLKKGGFSQKLISIIIPAIFIFVLYNCFRLEIADFWNTKYVASYLEINEGNDSYTNYHQNEDYTHFRIVWIYIYTLLFLAALSFVNIKKLKNNVLGYVLIVASTFAFLLFFTEGVFALTDLRQTYINNTLSEYYNRSVFNLLIRYIAIISVLALVFAGLISVKSGILKKGLQTPFNILLHIIILAILSTELIAWMDIAGSTQSYKLGLSILWGLYALLLIAIGIWKRKPSLRIMAIVLFGFTLLKLFLYDISDMNTISKTIVFVILGLLLLIISFLYNKFKTKITNDVEE